MLNPKVLSHYQFSAKFGGAYLANNGFFIQTKSKIY